VRAAVLLGRCVVHTASDEELAVLLAKAFTQPNMAKVET
jgi:hypothetical protein